MKKQRASYLIHVACSDHSAETAILTAQGPANIAASVRECEVPLLKDDEDEDDDNDDADDDVTTRLVANRCFSQHIIASLRN